MVSCDDADDFRRRCAADRYPKCSLFEEQAPSCGLPAHRTQSLEVVFEFQLYPLNLYSWSWPVVRPFEFSIEFDPLRWEENTNVYLISEGGPGLKRLPGNF